MYTPLIAQAYAKCMALERGYTHPRWRWGAWIDMCGDVVPLMMYIFLYTLFKCFHAH